jgi:hypothetical protein
MSHKGSIKHLIPPILTKFIHSWVNLNVRLRTRVHVSNLPSTGPPLESSSAYTNPFVRRTSICCEVGHAMPFQGGMKGCMVPGDAHPYLVPYDEYDKKVEIISAFFVWRCRL